ncbi:hypothetical protein EDD86DRAFT_202437 [Gorgonomyces haynaldii]|nr:hypothetical protein EDD86DRAFT_202437 [Gorgonomyces haynaldii]
MLDLEMMIPKQEIQRLKSVKIQDTPFKRLLVHLMELLREKKEIEWMLKIVQIKQEIQESVNITTSVRHYLSFLELERMSDYLDKEMNECYGLLKVKAKDVDPIAHFDLFDQVVFKETTLAWDLIAKRDVQAFMFHFMTNRPTNKIDKPEYFVQWLLKTIKQKEADLEGKDMRQFIGAFVPVIKDKLEREQELVVEQDALLAHTINTILELEAGFAAYGYTLHPFFDLYRKHMQQWMQHEANLSFAGKDDIETMLQFRSNVQSSAETMLLLPEDCQQVYYQTVIEPFAQEFEECHPHLVDQVRDLQHLPAFVLTEQSLFHTQ